MKPIPFEGQPPARERPLVLGATKDHTIVFAGPFGVGKTTAIMTVSDCDVVHTEEASAERDARAPHKTHTTVGIDYGEWRFTNGPRVALIGLPGQNRFDSTWSALLGTSAAVVLWLYGNQDPRLQEARRWITLVAEHGAMHRCAVAVTRLPQPVADPLLDPYRELVRPHNAWAPVVSADPRQHADVVQAIAIALAQTQAHAQADAK